MNPVVRSFAMPITRRRGLPECAILGKESRQSRCCRKSNRSAKGDANEYSITERKSRSTAFTPYNWRLTGITKCLESDWRPNLEKKGYPAIATASSAISASLGYQDGEKIKRLTLIDLIERIPRSVDVPVTADIETGYAEIFVGTGSDSAASDRIWCGRC